MSKYVACLLVLAAAACSSNSTRTTNPDGGGGVDGGKPTGASCGGFSGAHCAADELCDYADNTCGAADGLGTCKARPNVCPLPVPEIAGQVVCGCDGKVYSGTCTAAMGGTDLNANGGCALAAGRFECGFLQCDLTSQYCLHDTKATSPDQAYACVALPQACGATAACGCLSGVKCGTRCAGDGPHGLTVTCQ